jgi:hypothetical protein
MSVEMATDPNSDPSSFGFDPLAQSFRLLEVDPSTPDSGIDIAYVRARQQEKAPEAELAQAYAAIKDSARRLMAELAYPLDCPADLLNTFYSDAGTASNSDVLQTAGPFPPLSKVNFLIRSVAHLGVSDQLLLALVDGHAAIDAMEIYQTMQKTRHQAGHPAPSLMSVRSGLEDLLAAHCNVVVARADSAEVLADVLLAIRAPTEAAGERARLNVFSSMVNASRSPIDQALVRAQDEIRTICEALQARPDDIGQIERLAEKCRVWATLSDVLRPLEPVEPHQDENVVWERIRELLTFLIQEHHFQSAQRVIDVVTAELRPSPDQHSRMVALVAPFQQQLADELDRAEKDRKEAFSSRRSRRLRLALVAAGLIVLCCSAIVYLRVNDAPWLARGELAPASRTEPESLPPASRGQRYPLEYVRYCHYQEERLRIVKQHVHSQDDIRAYNALANDYNSRCANYFYQDEDLRTVKDEVTAKQKLLEADAQRIVSTWPWHVEPGKPDTSK